MLVSQGAYSFAASNDVPTCDAATLVAPHSIAEWKNWKKVLADAPSTSAKDPAAEMPIQDTVGAVSWDSNGKLAAGVSRFTIVLSSSCTNPVRSGGLLLKCPGRIGEVRKSHGHLGRSVETPKGRNIWCRVLVTVGFPNWCYLQRIRSCTPRGTPDASH